MPFRKMRLHRVNPGEGPFEIIRARWVLEGETAAMATQEATCRPIARRCARLLEDLRQSQNSAKQSEGADRRLHACAIGQRHWQNSPLAEMVQILWDQGRGALWKQMEHHFSSPEFLGADDAARSRGGGGGDRVGKFRAARAQRRCTST